MSLFKRFFAKKREEDYETVLATLAADIQKRQVKLSEIRLRERRSTLLVTLYTLAFWGAYVSLWYMNILPNGRGQSTGVEKALRGLPVVIGPIVILFVRRIVQVWYKRKGDAEEKTLQSLLKEQRNKVKEIKQKTNWDSMRDLFQRYEEPSPSGTPPRQRNAPGPTVPSTPQRMPPNPSLQTPAAPNAAVQSPITPTMVTPFPSVPPRKQWYDKVADALLGDDETTSGAPSTRYALICEKCFSHNGLVKESMWEDMQYICPKCNHFNPSARSRKHSGRQSLSPLTEKRSISGSTSASPSPYTSLLPSNAADPDAPNVDGAPELSLMEIDS